MSPVPCVVYRMRLTDAPKHSVAKRVVAERLGPNGIDRKDMLGSFLKHGLSREEAEGEALVNVIAGSDTTATAIRTTMLYLMSSPQAYRKLAHEIRTAAANGQISSPITDEEARTLPYLQAVIKEGMRVFPPVTGLMPTVVPPGGDVIRGIPVPEGTEIGWSAFGVQHNKGLYGLDAETFRPERWLEAKDEQLLQEMTSTWELVFKYGKWQCLGRAVALLELNKIFVEVRYPVLATRMRVFRFTAYLPASTALPCLRLSSRHACVPSPCSCRCGPYSMRMHADRASTIAAASVRLRTAQPPFPVELIQCWHLHPVRTLGQGHPDLGRLVPELRSKGPHGVWLRRGWIAPGGCGSAVTLILLSQVYFFPHTQGGTGCFLFLFCYSK